MDGKIDEEVAAAAHLLLLNSERGLLRQNLINAALDDVLKYLMLVYRALHSQTRHVDCCVAPGDLPGHLVSAVHIASTRATCVELPLFFVCLTVRELHLSHDRQVNNTDLVFCTCMNPEENDQMECQ